MKAAIVTSFDQPPYYGDIAEPVPRKPDDLPVDVLAAGLHRLTRARASGAHYLGSSEPPFTAGVDGVGRAGDGTLRYFVQGPGRPGSMADKTIVERARSIELPEGADPVTCAAAMNPAMAAWLALRCRVAFAPGQKVLVLGATGASGSMAVQIARHLGAAEVVAVGRDAQRLGRLRALGASSTATFGDPRLGALAADADVVLDFVWGEPAVQVMQALLRQRANGAPPLTWIHLGSMAGELAAIPGALLRSADLRIVGSGLGALSGADMLAQLPALAREIARETFHIDVRAVPLRDVEDAWSQEPQGGARIVFTP